MNTSWKSWQVVLLIVRFWLGAVVGFAKRKMASAFGVLVMLLAMVSTLASSTKDDFVRCERTVKNWASFSLDDRFREDKSTLRDLLFFLHIPRTGGRTYFHCILRKMYTSGQECPRSYDKLRFNPRKSHCRLMVTHDDYSMMSKLPKERTSVVTILRNPVDRVFSTYEFSVEVAARFLVHPNLTSATQMTRRIRPKGGLVSTLDIWPWKYLVPWMREDLFARRDARKLRGVLEMKEIGDPYDAENIVMPLQEFINDPIAHEIIHNGATFQVAGLTNNTYLKDSHEVRLCVRKHPVLGGYVLDVAKKRLDDMLYVGLTEDHKESATMFASMVGEQVLSQLQNLGSQIEQAANNQTDQGSTLTDSEPDTSSQLHSSINSPNASEIPSTNNLEIENENMTIEKLMEAYESCISNLRKSQAGRRVASLKRISPANFSKEARLHVPESVLHQVRSLNSLDVELYKHAQGIFAQQRKHLIQKFSEVEMEENLCSNYYGCYPWTLWLSALTVLLFALLIILFVTAKRRTSKLKV